MKQRTVKGQVLYEEGNYLVEFEGKRQVLKAGAMVDEPALSKAVGQPVEVVLGEYVVAVRPPHILCVVCYVPVDIFAAVELAGPEVRKGILQGLLKERLISQEIYETQMRTM